MEVQAPAARMDLYIICYVSLLDRMHRAKSKCIEWFITKLSASSSPVQLLQDVWASTVQLWPGCKSNMHKICNFHNSIHKNLSIKTTTVVSFIFISLQLHDQFNPLSSNTWTANIYRKKLSRTQLLMTIQMQEVFVNCITLYAVDKDFQDSKHLFIINSWQCVLLKNVLFCQFVTSIWALWIVVISEGKAWWTSSKAACFVPTQTWYSTRPHQTIQIEWFMTCDSCQLDGH